MLRTSVAMIAAALFLVASMLLGVPIGERCTRQSASTKSQCQLPPKTSAQETSHSTDSEDLVLWLVITSSM